MKQILGNKSFGKLIAVLLVVLLIITGCSNKEAGETNKDEPTVVRIGLTGSDSKSWNHVKTEAAKENIDIQLVFFDSYPLPNAALNAGEIELNAFQHYIYLNTEIEQHGYELTAIGETIMAPLGIYSEKLTGVDQIKDGETIVIPDDVTNGGRALLLLQANGLITVDPAAGLKPSMKDVINPRNFNIVELAATNIPASLQEVPLAVINSGVARDAGLIPSQDALVLEEVIPGENPYINVIVARTEDKDNPVFKRVVELYQTDAVKAIIAEDTKGSQIPVW